MSQLQKLVPLRFVGVWALSDTTTRSLVKTISWRITGSGATFIVGYLISGDIKIAGGIAIAQLITNTILYFVHERAWNRIMWGKENGTTN